MVQISKTHTPNTQRKITFEKEGDPTMSLDAFEFLFFNSAREACNDVNTFLKLRFINKQKPAGFFEKILYANELKVKKVSLRVPDLLQKIVLSRTCKKLPAISKILRSSYIFRNKKKTWFLHACRCLKNCNDF